MVKNNKGGRPRIPLVTPDLDENGLSDKLPSKVIDFEAVLYWMDLGATAEEIAGAFRVGVRTLDRRLIEHTGMGFGELKEKTCGAAKIKLRRNQFNLSETNASMAIWLGKVWLGQKEEVTNENVALEIIRLINSGDILTLKKNLAQREENEKHDAPSNNAQ